MARPAKVTSIDAVEAMAGVMKGFQDNAFSALENLGLEVQRALEWVRHEQKDYWTLQVRRGWEQLGEAKANLQRARAAQQIDGHEPSCVDEKRAVETARRRLQLAEEKVEAVRQWSRTVDRAVIEYQGCVGQVAGWLESDCSRAIASLERISATLRSYVALSSTVEGAMAEALPAARAAGAGLGDDEDLRKKKAAEEELPREPDPDEQPADEPPSPREADR